MTAAPGSLRELLRSQRVFPAGMPEFNPQAAPDDPVTLFLRWLEEALQDAVPAPHAMTLATADDGGRPSSRMLICKDVDGEGRWYEAEFWQGDPQRRHVRLQYRRAGSGWTRQLLWP